MAGTPGTGQPRPRRLPFVLLLTGVAALLSSGWAPYDRTVWWAETLPVSVGALLLVATYRRMPLSSVSYLLLWIFALILVVGGYYTYSRVPLGEWARDAFGLARNHFDRLGHFFQGVIPALLARELIVRTTPLTRGGWLFTVCTSVALAVSASYEIVEWWFAVAFGGSQAADFLGSQGDIWDAQKDMLMALLGAMSFLLLLGRLQQRQIERLSPPR